MDAPADDVRRPLPISSSATSGHIGATCGPTLTATSRSWCEKDALAGVLLDVTSEFDVPLMVSKGFASESYLHSAAAVITD